MKENIFIFQMKLSSSFNSNLLGTIMKAQMEDIQ